MITYNSWIPYHHHGMILAMAYNDPCMSYGKLADGDPRVASLDFLHIIYGH